MSSARSTGRTAQGLALGTVAMLASAGLLLPSPASAATPPAHALTYRAIGRTARLPHGDRVIGRLATSARVRADIVLQPANPSQLAAYAASVASPHSYVFRHYLSPSGGGVYNYATAKVPTSLPAPRRCRSPHELRADAPVRSCHHLAHRAT